MTDTVRVLERARQAIAVVWAKGNKGEKGDKGNKGDKGDKGDPLDSAGLQVLLAELPTINPGPDGGFWLDDKVVTKGS